MQTNRVFRRVGAVFGFIALVAAMSLPVFAKTKKPVVAIIKAEWCSACQKLEPTMRDLMKQYGDRLEFVVLDVSNEDKLAEANKTAKKYGLSDFLKEHQKKTSTVAVFNGDKVLFQTVQNFDRDAYVKAFDKALAES
jgi:thiol-disulfide isomerase/thioredoxin